MSRSAKVRSLALVMILNVAPLVILVIALLKVVL